MKRLALLAGLTLVGCAQRSAYVEPTNQTDRMLYFYEQDRFGGRHPISSETLDEEDYQTTQVPTPALVDVDSILQVKVHKPPGEPDETLLGSGADDLLVEKAELLELLSTLDAMLDARMKAVEAYRDGDPTADFEDEVVFQAQATRAFIRAFVARYERGSPEYVEANRRIGAEGLSGLKGMLEEQVGAVESEDDRIQRRARARSSTLRLEAFLEPPGKERTALHLKGYDRLPDGRLVARDRYGLNLSADERRELQSQIEATEGLARTLEQVRVKEISLEDGLRQSLAIAAPELADQLDAAEEVIERLADEDRVDRFRAELVAVLEKAREEGSGVAEDTVARIEGLPQKLEEELIARSEGVTTVLMLVTEARELERRWRDVENTRDLATLNALLADSASFAGRVEGAARDLPDWIGKALADGDVLLRVEIEGVEADAQEAFEAWLNSDEVDSLVGELQAYYADLREGGAVIREIGRLLKIGGLRADEVAPAVPEAFDVDIAQLQNTSLDFRRVPGRPGDTVQVRATLRSPGREPVESSASFELTHYGYYARLVPSVVLVRPDKLASGSEEFRFAPALGWMHHYRPRPENERWYATVLRPLQVAAGIHAIFLNFDNEAGIGLGPTLSLWNDRLQFGGGYNLSASSSDEGRYYFFVGSDLIGLLQTVGIGG